MTTLRCAVSFGALIAALPALAQSTNAQEIELDPIVISSGEVADFHGPAVALDSGGVSKTGDPVLTTPRSVAVITSQQLAERGASNIEEALQYSAGVQGGIWGLDDRSDWTLVRGFAPTNLHDGLVSRYGNYNDTKPETFMLNTVEVLKGPASGLYGASSTGGVINSTSKTSAQDSDNLWQLQIGSHNRKQIGLDVSGDLTSDGSLRYRFVGQARDAETIVDYSQNDNISLAPSITWRPSDDTELTLLANYQKTDGSPLIQFHSIYGTLLDASSIASGAFLDPSTFVGEPGFDRYDSEQKALTAQISHKFNDVWSVNATARYLEGESLYQHAWWSFDNYATGRYNPDGTINRTFYRAENRLKTAAIDSSLVAQYALGGWDLRSILGASYASGFYDSDTGYGTQVGPIDPFDPVYTGYPTITVTDTDGTTVTEWGVSLQNRAVLEDRWFVDFGLRFGDIETGSSSGSFGATTVSAQDSAWTGNVALLYQFDNGVAPYFSWAESFQQDAIGTDVNGTAFDPTRGEQFELGVKYQPSGTDTLVSAALFDLTKSNILINDAINPGYYVQEGEAKTRGLELQAQKRFGDLFVDAAYTYTDSEGANGGRLAQVPYNAASIWMNYRPSAGTLQGWSFGGGVRYTGATWDGSDPSVNTGYPSETPSYTLVDAAVSYGRDNWELALNIRNLADKRYVTTCQGGACYFGDGRNVTLTLTSKF